MNTSSKLIKRLKALGLNIPEGTYISRTKAGRNQKAAGAWSWNLCHADSSHAGLTNIGSCYTVRDCVRAKQLEIIKDKGMGIEIVPEDLRVELTTITTRPQ